MNVFSSHDKILCCVNSAQVSAPEAGFPSGLHYMKNMLLATSKEEELHPYDRTHVLCTRGSLLHWKGAQTRHCAVRYQNCYTTEALTRQVKTMTFKNHYEIGIGHAYLRNT